MINLFAWIDPFLIGAFQTNFISVCPVKTLFDSVFDCIYFCTFKPNSVQPLSLNCLIFSSISAGGQRK